VFELRASHLLGRYKYCVHIYVNENKIPAETILGIRRGDDERE
jgi:hypothetical protein